MAVQAAPALAAVRLSARLQRSREHLVASREEERRRLRRDLHDGVGAALAGARLQLESAHERVSDPVTRRILEAAVGAVGEAVDGVRHVTEDLRPPALDELGLAACLGLLAERMTGPGSEVQADIAALAPVGAAAEVAAYRIASEALANAAPPRRSQRASGCRRRSWTARLRVEVRDDGRGLPERTRPGRLGPAVDAAASGGARRAARRRVVGGWDERGGGAHRWRNDERARAGGRRPPAVPRRGTDGAVGRGTTSRWSGEADDVASALQRVAEDLRPTWS